MRLMMLAGVALALLQSTGRAADAQAKPQSVEQQLRSLLEDQQKQEEKLHEEFAAAKEADRQKIYERYRAVVEKTASHCIDLAERNPKDPAAVDALIWVVANLGQEGTSPTVAKAMRKLTEEYATSERIRPLCPGLATLPVPSREKFLQAVWEKNPKKQIKGLACLGLARHFKNLSDDATSKEIAEKAANEAEKYYKLVLEQYGDIETDRQRLRDAAESELYEIRHLTVGRTAPEIQGEDGGGKKLKLSDYRGKVVVLHFWATWCPPCMAMVPHDRTLVKRFEGKPFALLGIDFDESRDELKKTQEKEKMSWPSWFDGHDGGPIGKQWNIQYLPMVYVLDAKGVIRYKGLRGDALDQAVETLLKEMETGRRN